MKGSSRPGTNHKDPALWAVHPIPSHLLCQALEPDALADQGQLLLCEVAAAAHTQLVPEAPDPALGGVEGVAVGLPGAPEDLRTPGWQLA